MDEVIPASATDGPDPLQAFAELALIVIDTNPPERTLRRVSELAKQTLDGVEDVSLTVIEDGRARSVVFTGTVREMARETDISIVEPNDEQASIDQLLAEGVVPGDQLRTQTRDQHHRRVARLTQGVVSDVDITHRGLHNLRGSK